MVQGSGHLTKLIGFERPGNSSQLKRITFIYLTGEGD